MADRIQTVEDVRPTTGAPFASLVCGVQGHAFRVVTRNNQPIGLECTRCCKEWTVEEIAEVAAVHAEREK